MGHALVRAGTTVYVFGGYSCRQRGQSQRGGADCYSDAMLGFDLVEQTWFKVAKSGRSLDGKALWKECHERDVLFLQHLTRVFSLFLKEPGRRLEPSTP